jgi:hypothetical protein
MTSTVTIMRVPYLGQYKRNFQNVIFTQPRNTKRVFRVSVQSSELGLPPPPQANVAPQDPSGGKIHSFAGEGMGDPIQTKGQKLCSTLYGSDLHKGRPNYRRTLQPSKENIQQKMKFINFFYFCGSFLPSWIRKQSGSRSGSGSTTLYNTFREPYKADQRISNLVTTRKKLVLNAHNYFDKFCNLLGIRGWNHMYPYCMYRTLQSSCDDFFSRSII